MVWRHSCRLHPGAQPRWLTAGLTVTPEARRTGVGRRLLHTVIGAVADRGGGDLHSVVNAGTVPSLTLHAFLGFEIVDVAGREVVDAHAVTSCAWAAPSIVLS